MNFYKQKESQYYSQSRMDLVPYIIKSQATLDIGCSGGNMLCYLKEKGLIKEAFGVDLMDIEGSNQKNHLIDKFIAANVEEKKLDLPVNYFDQMLCADILEHLADPWDILKYLKEFCKQGARIIISIPNIREYRALYKIFFKGNFQYESSGILDKTHLRFFCKKNMINLVKEANFEIIMIQPTFKTCPFQKRRKLLGIITFGIFDQFLAQQYIVVARKND